MYRLTGRMLQHYENDLRKFHSLFMGDRCSAWQQEELLVAAIKSDTRAQHQVFWREAGHDDKADIWVRTNGETHAIEVKSGQIQGKKLVLSGHRLGRFVNDSIPDIAEMTGYLNAKTADIIAFPAEKNDDEDGREFVYRVCYIDVKKLTSLDVRGWAKVGKTWKHTNDYGVNSSISPSMSWQIWWRIPLEVVEFGKEIVIR